MSINAFDSIADQTQQQLFAQYETLLSASSALAEQLQQRFKQWRTETKEVLARDFPLAAQQQELDDWQQQNLAGAHNKSHLEQGIKAFGQNIDGFSQRLELLFFDEIQLLMQQLDFQLGFDINFKIISKIINTEASYGFQVDRARTINQGVNVFYFRKCILQYV